MTFLTTVVPMALLGGVASIALRPRDCAPSQYNWNCFDENIEIALPGLIVGVLVALITAVWVGVWVARRKVQQVEAPEAEG